MTTEYKVTDNELTSIANAIRTKGGTSDVLEFPDGFIDAVRNIPTGGGGSPYGRGGVTYVDTFDYDIGGRPHVD